MPNYIPKLATIGEACDWLQHKTAERWTLARLLENGMMPWFWLDYSPGWPAVFGDKKEGYLAPMIFTGDTNRLAVVGGDVVLTMTRTHDGNLCKIDAPTWRISIDELRFKREDLEEEAKAHASAIDANRPATFGAPENAAPPVPVVTDAGTTGMVAWQAAILENLNAVIIPEKGDKTPARHVLMWCRLRGPRDVFPTEQPNERNTFVWRDKAGGGLHTVQLGTVNNVWSGWRKAGKLTVQR